MARIAKTFMFTFFAATCFGQSTMVKYLSGKDKDHTVAWDFFCTKGANSGTWSKIQVPSCWETQGFGTYHYGWEENFKENETGLYKLAFDTEPSWKGKTIKLVFEGSMTDTEVKINGKPAGPKHQGSFYRFKYDITKLLKDNNLLEVKVDKISSDTSVNRAERMSDFWVFGGLHRPVYLEILPTQYIDWVAVNAKADGTFVINVYPSGITNANAIEAQIQTLDGSPVGQPFHSGIARGQSRVTLQTKISNPQLWNPESPKRYKVLVQLKNAERVIHETTEKFGFRTIEFREGNGFFVNGKKVIFKGVNRHTFWPTSGRTTSKAISILDVNMIKDMNMNAVRMSHYPPETHFLDVCDSLGLFVLDELTGWQKKYDTPVGKKLVREMIMKDVNHPSIIMWDNGNEGGNNHELVDEYAKYDPQNRKVIHPWNVFNGTDTQHYKGYDCCVGSLNHGTNVFFPTEFLHGLHDGGHAAGLDDHWSLNEQNPLFAGGFLWDFADEGIVRLDQDSAVDIKDNRAPDGIVGPYREKEGSYFAIKEIWSPVQIKEKKLLPDFDGSLTVENKFLYTNLNAIQFQYELAKLPGHKSNHGIAILEKGNFYGPELDPLQTGIINIPVKSDFANADVLFLIAHDPYGRLIYKWSWPLKNVHELNQDNFLNRETSIARGSLVSNTIELSANGISIVVDSKTGLIRSVKNGNTDISFTNGPSLTTGTGTVKSFQHFAKDNNYVINFTTDGEMRSLTYTMLANGILKIDYSYNLYGLPGSKEFDFMGISFNYPEDKVTGIKLAGRGPYRVWKNRMKGNEYGIWQKLYNNTITGESWVYPEFKGYYRDFQWVVIENKEQPFAILADTDNLFLRLYTPQKPKGATNNNTSPDFPSGDISVLHAINAVGTKFDLPAIHGPQGAKNKIGWENVGATIFIDFRSN